MYDPSGIGTGEDLEELLEQEPTAVPDDDAYDGSLTTERVVKNCSLKYFRKKLVMHFDVLWSQHRLVWPNRLNSN
jgi:hypothetical protein